MISWFRCGAIGSFIASLTAFVWLPASLGANGTDELDGLDDAHIGRYASSIAAPDALETTKKGKTLRVTGGGAAPERAADVGMVKFDKSTSSGATAVFTGRSTNWGCLFTVNGVFVGGNAGGPPPTWTNQFKDRPRIVLEVNGPGNADNYVGCWHKGGALTVTMKGGSAGVLYQVDLTATPQLGFDNPAPPPTTIPNVSVKLHGEGDAVKIALNGKSAGPFTITASCSEAAPSSVTINGVVIDVEGATELWYFDGESPAGYDTRTTLAAKGVTKGTFEWSVTKGADKIAINDNGTNVKSVTRKDENTVEILAISPTPGGKLKLDITIEFSYNGFLVWTNVFVVRTPATFDFLRNEDHAEPFLGYESRVHYKILDQFNAVLPADVPVNEKFTSGAIRDVPPGEPYDWVPSLVEGGALADPSDCDDFIQGQAVSHVPKAVPPTDPDAGVRVQHRLMEWRVGSATPGKGMRVASPLWKATPTCSQQKYRGYARHE